MSLVVSVYLISLAVFLVSFYFTKRLGLFHIVFSVLFGSVIFLGPPLTFLLEYVFSIVSYSHISYVYALVISSGFYFVFCFFSLILPRKVVINAWLSISNTHYNLFSFSIMLFGLLSLVIFVLANGFLFFKLNDYDELFSSGITYSWIRKFFYFFFVGMIALYLNFRTKAFLYLFLFVCLIFGTLSYLAVGGSRANLVLSVIFFIILGVKDKHVRLGRILLLLPFVFLLMSFLAIARYSYIPEGTTLLVKILSLTKGTFSPWENVAVIFERYESIEFQYFWPIVRDFYQYVPKSLWLETTDVIMNTGNYLTFVVLDNVDGLTFSPTLIGSLLIMGGVGGVFFGSLLLSYVSWFFELLYFNASVIRSGYRLENFSKVCLCYCISVIFFQISLVRDGVDTFISRVIFFTAWFVLIFIFTYIFLILFYPKRKLM